MGLYDRQYARPDGGGFRTTALNRFSVTVWIIIVNVVVFIASVLVATPRVPVYREAIIANAAASTAAYTITGDFLTPDQLRQIAPMGGALAGTVEQGRNQYKLLVNAKTKEEVGLAVYVMTPPLQALGHFSTATGFQQLQVWRLVTFQFLHAGIGHLFFNMFGLYIFGATVERYLGAKRYLAFYLMCGIAGGLMYLLLNLCGVIAAVTGLPSLPGFLNISTTTPLVGASAGVFGVIVACARLEPNTQVVLLFPPIPIRLKYLAYIYVGVALWNLLMGGDNAGGDAAHIGGAIAGYFFISRGHLLGDFFDVFSDSRRVRGGRKGWFGKDAGGVGLGTLWGRGAAKSGAGAGAAAMPPDRAEVDRILDKVARDGIGSLSEAEKRVLAADTEKLRRRAGDD